MPVMGQGVVQFLLIFGSMGGQLQQGFLIIDAVARHVFGLRLNFAQCRQRLDPGQKPPVAASDLDPLPGVLGQALIGLRAGQHLHFLLQPAGPVVSLKLAAQALVYFP